MASKIDFSSVSYVLGVLSIVFAFFSPFAGLVLGIIGYTQSSRRNVAESKKLNVIGIIISVIFIIVMLLSVFLWGGVLGSGGF